MFEYPPSPEDREQDRLAEIGDMKRDTEIDNKLMTYHPTTLCCGYAASLDRPYPVMWNEFNKVVQCHNCGHQYTPENSELKDTIATLETRHAAAMLHAQSIVDDALKFRILLHEFAIVSMRIKTALTNFSVIDDLTTTEQQWLKEVEWLIDAAKEYPLTKEEMEAWEAKKKTKRWSE